MNLGLSIGITGMRRFGPLSIDRTYFDVSSVTTKLQPNDTVFAVLELTNENINAVLKYYNVTDSAYMEGLETTLGLNAAFSGATTKIAIISDVHIQNESWSLTNTINAIDDDITGCSKVLVLGDIVNDIASGYATYKTERDTSDIAVANWHELAGNHDVLTGSTGFKAELLGSESALAYYSVTVGNVVFMMVSTESGFSCLAAANTWLMTELASNASNNCFIMCHQPRMGTTRYSEYSISSSVGWMNGIDLDALDSADFVAWISGHSHGYTSFTEPDSDRIFTGTPEGVFLPNGDIETDGDLWTGTAATVSVEDTITHDSSNHSIKIIDAGGAAGAQRRIELQSGTVYTVSGWVRSDSSNTGTYLARIAVTTQATGNDIPSYMTDNTADGEGVAADDTWHLIEETFTATQNAAFVTLGCQNATDDVSCFDDIDVEEYADTTAPTLESLTVDGTTWVATFSEPVDAIGDLMSEIIPVMSTAGTVTLSDVSDDGTIFTGLGDTAVVNGETGTYSYTDGSIADTADNELANITDGTVINNTAAVTSIYTTDFNSPTYSVDNINGQDGWVATGVRHTISDTQSRSGLAYKMSLNTFQEWGYHTFTAQTTKFTVELWLYTDGSGPRISVSNGVVGDTATYHGPYLKLESNTVSSYNGSTYDDLASFTSSTWFKLEMEVDVANNNVEFWIDGTQVADGPFDFYTDQSSLDRIAFKNNGESNTYLYVDDLTIYEGIRL